MVAAGSGPSGPSVNEGSEARCFAGLQETGEGDDDGESSRLCRVGDCRKS